MKLRQPDQNTGFPIFFPCSCCFFSIS
jgi:hypothetical protein